jgi:chromodomain-helicase-DNA-binding protein 7
MKVDFICNDCKNNSVSCFICKKKGFYYGVEYQKNKKTKGKPNVEEKEVTPKNKKKNEVTKCSTANCSKYFHPKCV